MIEPDAPEANCGFFFPARVRDEDNRMLRVQHGSSPCCVLADESDIDASSQMRRSKFGCITRIEDLRALRLQLEYAVKRQRVHLARQRLVQRRPLFTVQHSVVVE